MSAIQTSLYLVAVALCVFSTGVTTRARRKPLTYFTGFLLIQSAAFLGELLISHPATPLKALWLALLMSGSLLLAPCLWLAFQESVGGARPRLRDVPRAHWLPVIAGFALTLPLLSSAHLGTTWNNPAQPAGWLYSKAIHTTMLLCIGIFVVQVPWYLQRCREILVARLGSRSHWAQLPLAIVLTTWGLAIVRTLDCAFIKWPPLFSLIVALVSVGVTVGTLYLLLRQFTVVEPKNGEAGEASYAKSPLGPALRARIRNKLEAQLTHIYRRSDLTLGSLSETLNENPHYVSQVISQELGTSFYELLSRHRVDAARRRLLDSPEESVLSIAMEVGFNSKSAFHAAFRRVTGMSPTDFRRNTSSPMGKDAGSG